LRIASLNGELAGRFAPLLSGGAGGAAVVLAIAAGSCVALAVLLARAWALRRTAVAPRKLRVEVRDRVLRDLIPEAMTACRADDSPLARILLSALRLAGKSRARIKESVEEVGRLEAATLGRGLAVLETVAVTSPLLGLFGTVWGMIDLFLAIETHGVGKPAALAGGIGTALYTTFAGLVVAIPVRMAHAWLGARIDARVLELQECAIEFVDLLGADSEGGP
jgi:biopolymer transport protein ExbB